MPYPGGWIIVAGAGTHGIVRLMNSTAGVGLSRKSDSRQAAREAGRLAIERAGVERADWGLMFATTTAHRPHFAAMLAETQDVLGTQTLSGCSAYGVLEGNEEVEGEPAVVVLAVRSDTITAEPLLAPEGEDRGLSGAREIGRRIAGRPGIMILMPDPFALHPDAILDAIGKVAPGVVAIGAAASSDPVTDRTFQFFGRNVATRSLAALHLGGRFHTSIGVTQGCQPLGDACQITRCADNVILELDGRPALETLLARLPRGLHDEMERLSGHLFVGLPPDPGQQRIEPGEYLVRHLIGTDTDRGALVVGADVRQGEPILLVLREGQSAREDLKQMLDRLVEGGAGEGACFGLYFNCAARGRSLYGLPGIDTAYLSRSFGDLPIAGFFGNAEIAPLRGANRLFTYTGVLALFRDAE